MARPRKGEFLPVDDDRAHHLSVQDHPDRGRIEALFDQKLFHSQIRRERSAAFWMAASIWGVSGLIIGGCLGAYMTFNIYTGVTPSVRDNLMAGAAMDEARQTVNDRDSLVHDELSRAEQQR
ncbi:MAG: hypothetical protein WDM79_01240 [Terricaulis sp.]